MAAPVASSTCHCSKGLSCACLPRLPCCAVHKPHPPPLPPHSAPSHRHPFLLAMPMACALPATAAQESTGSALGALGLVCQAWGFQLAAPRRGMGGGDRQLMLEGPCCRCRSPVPSADCRGLDRLAHSACRQGVRRVRNGSGETQWPCFLLMWCCVCTVQGCQSCFGPAFSCLLLEMQQSQRGARLCAESCEGTAASYHAELLWWLGKG